MYFSYQTVVLAALAFETAFAQPHRQMHQHHPRALSDVLGKRDGTDWNSPENYKNPVTGKPYSDAEWACFVAKKGDKSCNTIDTGSDTGSGSPSPSPTAAAAAPKEKIAQPQSHASSAPKAKVSASSGSEKDSGPGVHLFNKGSGDQTFVFYKNDANDYGQNTSPDDGGSYTVAAGADKFVSLPLTWKGHIQRGQSNLKVSSPATWAEVQVQASSDGAAWGDITLQKGCDGPAMIISPTDGTAFGFTKDIISGAPAAAKVKTFDGQDALGFTEPGWMGPINEPANEAARAWEYSEVGQSNVYIVGGTGTNNVHSSNNIVHVEFY